MAKRKKKNSFIKVGQITKVTIFFDKYSFYILSIIFLAFTFGFYLKKSFTHQELDYVRISTWSIHKIIFENYGDQLPLWFIFLKIFRYIFGNSEIAMKILSVGIFLSAGYVLFRLANYYKLNKNLILALFLSSPLLIEDTAYKPKHWGFLILICLLSLYLYEKFKFLQNKKNLFLLLGVIFLGVYSNFVYLIFLFPLFLYFTRDYLLTKINFKKYLTLLITTAIFVLPVVAMYYTKARHQLVDVQGMRMDWGAPPGLEFLRKSFEVMSGTNYLTLDYQRLIYAIIIFFLIVQIFQLEKLFVKRWLVFSVIFSLLVIMFTASYTPIRYRYINFTIPLFYLAVIPKSRNYFLRGIGILLLTLTIISASRAMEYYRPEDWKGASNFIKPQLKENSQVFLMFNESAGPFVIEYYLGIPPKRIAKVEDTSVFYSDDIWVLRRDGDYDKIYTLSSKYKIEDFNDFQGLKLVHLIKKENEKTKDGLSNHLIYAEPQISIESNGKTKNCQYDNGTIRSDCFSEEWQQIQLDRKVISGEGKVCLFAHPRNNSQINIAYKNVALTDNLKISTGISDDRVMDGQGSPIYMDVYIDGGLDRKIINPDIKGWIVTNINTSAYKRPVDVKFVIYANNDEKRHFCFDAEKTNAPSKEGYFYDNLSSAIAKVGNKTCEYYKINPIWPHNEQRPPFYDSRINQRWDCEDNLVNNQKIWETVGQSFAISGGVYKDAIWFHPSVGQTKSLEYTNINKPAKKITGYYGFNDLSSEKNKDATINFTIYANGEEIFKDSFSLAKGWKNFEIPFDKQLENAKFEVQTTNNRWNHFFFNAFIEN